MIQHLADDNSQVEFHIITPPESLSSDFFYKDPKAAFTSNDITIESVDRRTLSSPAHRKRVQNRLSQRKYIGVLLLLFTKRSSFLIKLNTIRLFSLDQERTLVRQGRKSKDKCQLPRGRPSAEMTEALQGRMRTLSRTTARALKRTPASPNALEMGLLLASIIQGHPAFSANCLSSKTTPIYFPRCSSI